MSSCYFCGSEEEIEEHHIVPQRLGGSDKRSNTVDLCHDCHWKLERLYNKEFWEAIGIEDPRTTRETHITCEYHSCTNPATTSYSVVGLGSSSRETGYVYRCDEHSTVEIEAEDEDEGEDELPDLRCLGEDSAPKFIRRLTYAFEKLLEDEPATRPEIRETLTSDRITYIGFPGEQGETVTEVQLLVGKDQFSASYSGGSWEVSYEGRHREAREE